MTPKRRLPLLPLHPGEILLDDFLRPRKITQMALAAHLEVPMQRINGLINGKRGITPETAWLLAMALGTTPEFWMDLQVQYDLAEHRPEKLLRAIG